MKVYLASRYSRREELVGYQQQVENAGGEVTSRWLDGDHQIADGEEAYAVEAERFAVEDMDDVLASSVLVAFTEEPRQTNSRGGRHVELGVALGLLAARRNSDGPHYFGPPMNRVLVVGPRENVFTWLPDVEYYATWDEAFDALRPDLDAAAQWDRDGVRMTVRT